MDEDYDRHVRAVQFLKEAQTHFEEGSFEKMAAPLEECLNLDNSLTLGWELLGLYCLHTLALKDALMAFENAEKNKDRSTNSKIALRVMRSPTWPHGEEMLDAVNGVAALGQTYLSNGNWRPSLLCFKAVEQYIEQTWKVHSIMGLIYRELGLLEMSLEHYSMASQLEDAPIELMHDRSVVLIKLGRFDEAEKVLRSLLDDIEDNPQLWNNLGAVLEAQEKDEDALEVYEKAISLDDGYYPALYSKGRILQKQGKMEEARPFLEKALDIEGRVYDLDDVTSAEDRSKDGMVHIKEVTDRSSKRKGPEHK
jgi:tetratricopeptide (TPR) repeat protein